MSPPRSVVFATAPPMEITYESKAPGWPRGRMGTAGIDSYITQFKTFEKRVHTTATALRLQIAIIK